MSSIPWQTGSFWAWIAPVFVEETCASVRASTCDQTTRTCSCILQFEERSVNSWLTKMSTQQYNIIPQNLTVKWEISERKPPVTGSYQTLMTGLEKTFLTWNIPTIFNMKTTLYKMCSSVYYNICWSTCHAWISLVYWSSHVTDVIQEIYPVEPF